ncbi:histidine phosphatase family protein [Pseudomonadota bacterium]
MRTLLLLRHGKSDWGDPSLDDIDRPLNKRGRLAVNKIASWMKRHDTRPESVISSPSVRTKQTLNELSQTIRVEKACIRFDERIYLASRSELLTVLGDCSGSAAPLLLVGHNPGFESLLTYLCGDGVPVSKTGKLFPTATLAEIALPDDWQRLQANCGRLINLVRPKEINA